MFFFFRRVVDSDKKKKVHQLSSKMLLEDLKPGLYSKYKPFLKRDSGFFKRLKRVRATFKCVLYDRQRGLVSIVTR